MTHIKRMVADCTIIQDMFKEICNDVIVRWNIGIKDTDKD